MALSAHTQQLALNALFHLTAPALPAALYAALFNGDPYGAGTELSVANGYARQAVTFGAPIFSGGGYQVANTGAVTFGPNTGTNWGVVDHIAIYDASTGGNLMDAAALSVSETVAVTGEVVFAIGTITTTIT